MAARKRNHSAAAIVVDAEEGSYLLKIDGYSRTKLLVENGKYVRSTRFSAGGHDWALEFYPNGYKSADFISVYLFLDSTDSKDVKAKFTFSLLDKDEEPVPSFSQTHPGHTFPGKGSDWGYFDFIKKTDLEESVHLINDCFTIQCDVTVMKEIRRIEARHKRKLNQFVAVPPSNLHRHLGDLLKSRMEPT
jgi:speckle-type POZ protein